MVDTTSLSYFIRLSAVFDAIPDALIIVDKKGNIVLTNQQVENLFGYPRASLLGDKVEKLIAKRFHAKHANYQQSYYSNPHARPIKSGFDLVGARQDGTEFPIEINFSPLNTDEGVVTLEVIRDITKRKKNEAKFAAIVEAAPDCLLIVNKDGQIILANDLAEKLFGYKKEQLIGQEIELLMPARYRKKHIDHRHDYYHEPRARPMGNGLHLFGLHKDGHEFPVEISLSPLETEEGLLTLAAIRDITKQKQLEQELIATNDELKKIDLAKDRFLSGMSHELRTPLNAIIGFTNTLLLKLPGPINNEQEKQLKIINGSANFLLSIINDILDLAKIESDEMELRPEEINCLEIITDVIKCLTPLAEIKKIVLKEKINTDDTLLTTDRRSLTQILINLVNNAIKFTNEGYVLIELERKNINKIEYIVINVIDTGIGIKKEDYDKIFTAFKQIGAPGYKGTGTGLGLYLSKKLIELMHGKIEFESEFEKGTRFSILLPK